MSKLLLVVAMVASVSGYALEPMVNTGGNTHGIGPTVNPESVRPIQDNFSKNNFDEIIRIQNEQNKKYGN
jgi:hypothetical protein